jgi:hypothetical protein
LLVKYNFVDSDYLRISLFLEQSNNLFRTSSFIKNFEILNFILHIYKQSNILGTEVRFKNLKTFTTKSDVYLSNLLKNGLESGYLSIHLSPKDKRSRSYQLTEQSLNFIRSLDFELELDVITENYFNKNSSCPYCSSQAIIETA